MASTTRLTRKPGSNHCLTVCFDKPVHLAVWLYEHPSLIIMRLSLPTMLLVMAAFCS